MSNFGRAAAFLFLLAGCNGSSPGECPAGQHRVGSDCSADPCTPNPCDATHACQPAPDGTATCACPAGTHDAGGRCVLDGGCDASSCSGHGTCSETAGAATCACDPGFAPPRCSGCATGWHDDGAGGCSNDPCTPNPCSGPNRHCVAQNGSATCACAPGYHDDNGACVPDTTCSPTSCAGHGTCMDGGGKAVCTCDPGWAGAACAACDALGGWHDDGAGGCTKDPCTPNPCTQPRRTVCTLDPLGAAACGCDAGYHLDAGSCVPDEVCAPSSCSGHGSCTVVQGRVACTCAAGYTGASCAACDTGWHDDGAGGCTTDACLPNPCTAPHKTVCSGAGACTCDAGYHDDGAGGCSNDPCTPNPCLATNQACRVVSGSAQCYTPPCDDLNPCTTDSVVGGACQHVALVNGTSCQTSLCLVGQTCQAGACSGGGARSCDDSNPCTDDSCSPTLGCQHANDDANVPSDGHGCTIDQCAGGVASHTPSNAACDDGLWCTGVEICDPAGAGADANGCRHSSVPQPPVGVGPCRTVSACSEATHSFPLTPRSAGSGCDDGLACTTGDQCDGTGACRGAAIAGCSEAGTCAGTTPLMSTIDVPYGDLQGTFTLNGGPLPATYTTYTGGDFYLVAKDTGVSHYIGSFRYNYQSPSTYVLAGNSYSARLVTGVYDLVYARNCSPGSTCYANVDASLGPMVNGYRRLVSNVVIGPGLNQRDIDVPLTNVTGAITLGGGALPPTYSSYTGGDFYLIAKDTGVNHYIGGFRYNYQAPGNYVLAGNAYSARVVPGNYDLVYARNCSPGSTCYANVDTSLGPMVNGYRVLVANVAVSGANQTLDIDVPLTNVTGTMTLGGGALPPTYTTYTGGDFYLVAKDTGVIHYIGGFRYNYQAPGNYVLAGNTYSARVVPGNYDLVYARNCSPGSTCYANVDTSLGPMVNGYRVLVANVSVSGANQTLDIDVPLTNVTGTMTLGGGALPPTYTTYTGGDFYLVAKDTGVNHYIGGFRYNYQAPGNYVLAGNTYSARVVPGNYDLVYARNCSPGSTCYANVDTSLGPMVNGYRVLVANVAISGANQTLDIDVPLTNVTGSMTLGGGALPPTYTTYTGGDFYLVAKDTGVNHYIGGFRYNYQAPGNYVLAGNTYSARLVPGKYDLVYARNCSPGSTCYTNVDASLGPMVNGYRVLTANVTINGANQTLDINVPLSNLTGPITLDGAPLPATYTTYTGGDFYLSARDTLVNHYIGSFSYNYQSPSIYVLASSTYSARVVPGAYDLIYARNCSPGSTCYANVDSSLGPMVNGYRVLRACVAAP